ncbi:MAG: ABC transporter permease [Phycicoccus sp.]|nr:ABC transporter permease [Phycicoccus sp.]
MAPAGQLRREPDMPESPRRHRPSRNAAGVPEATVRPTRLTLRDLVSESLAGLSQRPARTVLTMLGTVLGVGSFVAVLGLTATASGQISGAFSVMTATQITITDAGAGSTQQSTVYDFPPGSDSTIQSLNGVLAAGVRWSVGAGPQPVSANLAAGSVPQQIAVSAATPGYLHAIEPRLTEGTLWGEFHEQRTMSVAVIGSGVARQLGIASVASQPAIFIKGQAFTVIGILAGAQRDPTAAITVYIPAATARNHFGNPVSFSPASMLVRTQLGAADLIAHQAPLALRPDDPQILQAAPPPTATVLRDDVLASLNSLFVVLAAITLIIGAVGIANTTLVAVMERTGEIGLRRAVGARRRHIAAQFLTESAAIGTLGGLIGTAIAVSVIVGVAIARHWTAVIDPALTLPAPLIGTVTGLLAGAYPALRAARIEPLEALRR